MSGIFLSSDDYVAVQNILLAGSKQYGTAAVERLAHAFAASAGFAPAITPESQDQRPELVIPGLTAKPWYEASDFSFCRHVEAAAPAVRTDVENIMRSSAVLQTVQRDRYVPSGRWDALFIRIGSTWLEENRSRCPHAFRLTESIPRVSQLSMISVLSAGGHIAPHCGRWNCRLTFHLGLSIPPNCGLRVGSQTRAWEPDKLLVFDDTFEHEAWNRSDEPRCVLLFDVWHPDLTDVEVEMLERLREEAGIHDGMATMARRAEEPLQYQNCRRSVSAASIGIPLDWAELAEPRSDEYDTNVILWLVSAGRQNPYRRAPLGDSPAVFDESVAVRYVYQSCPEFETLSAQYPDAPLDHPNIRFAAEYIRSWPVVFQQCRRLLEAIHPAIDPELPSVAGDIYGGAVCCSLESFFGTMWSTIGCPFGLAEAMVREMANQKLRVLSAVLRLAPPVMAALSAHYSNLYVATLDMHLIQGLRDSAARDSLSQVLRRNIAAVQHSRLGLTSHRHLCDSGQEFIDGVLSWTDRVIL